MVSALLLVGLVSLQAKNSLTGQMSSGILEVFIFLPSALQGMLYLYQIKVLIDEFQQPKMRQSLKKEDCETLGLLEEDNRISIKLIY